MTRRIDWNLAVSGVPTCDWMEGLNLEQEYGLELAVEDFSGALEFHRYLCWESVIRKEQGLPIEDIHRAKLDELFTFVDAEEDELIDEGVHAIDEVARPLEPWYESFRRIARHLLMERFRTGDLHHRVVTEGWPRLVGVVTAFSEGLSLPKGVESPVDVIPLELQHRLWLQTCIEPLEGIGQEYRPISPNSVQQAGILTLENSWEHVRIEVLIDNLRDHEESIRYLELTLQELLTVLALPEKDEPIFIRLFMDAVGLESMSEPIADHL